MDSYFAHDDAVRAMALVAALQTRLPHVRVSKMRSLFVNLYYYKYRSTMVSSLMLLSSSESIQALIGVTVSMIPGARAAGRAEMCQ